MAEFVNTASARAGLCMVNKKSAGWFVPWVPCVAWMACALGLASFAAAGETLPDPTRPGAAEVARQQTVQQPLAGPELQSVLVSPQRKLAVINGQTLHIGERYGDSVVVQIKEREVVLKNGKVLQTLRLFPVLENGKSQAGNPASPSKKDQ